MSASPVPPQPPQDEIDLRSLFLALWEKRFLILAGATTSLLLTAVYAFLVAKPTFVSSALLLPTQTTVNTDLGSAAALLGKKMGSAGDIDLYQSLLTSRTVLSKVLLVPIRNESDTGRGRVEPVYRVLGIDTANPDDVSSNVESLSKSVIVDSKSNGAGGILEIKFFAGSPWMAQQLGEAILATGQEELRLVQIQRSDVIISRLAVAVELAKSEWDTTARAVALYTGRNRSISLPDQILELSRLEIEKSAKEQKYLLARREFEVQLLERAKAAPPTMILDPANRPSREVRAKRSLILALGLMFGIAVSSVGVLAWKAFVISSPE